MKVNAQGSDESLAGEGIDVAGGVRDMESLGFPDGAFDAVVCVSCRAEAGASRNRPC
jgi:hypothetical protein